MSPSAALSIAGTHAIAMLMAAKQKGIPSSMVVKCGICCWYLTKLWTLAKSTKGCKVNPVGNMQRYVMQRRCIGSCLPRPFTKPICILRQAVCHQTWHCKIETGKDQRQEACACYKYFLTHPHILHCSTAANNYIKQPEIAQITHIYPYSKSEWELIHASLQRNWMEWLMRKLS